jgi:hypothetical protein
MPDLQVAYNFRTRLEPRIELPMEFDGQEIVHIYVRDGGGVRRDIEYTRDGHTLNCTLMPQDLVGIRPDAYVQSRPSRINIRARPRVQAQLSWPHSIIPTLRARNILGSNEGLRVTDVTRSIGADTPARRLQISGFKGLFESDLSLLERHAYAPSPATAWTIQQASVVARVGAVNSMSRFGFHMREDEVNITLEQAIMVESNVESDEASRPNFETATGLDLDRIGESFGIVRHDVSTYREPKPKEPPRPGRKIVMDEPTLGTSSV